MSSHLRLAPSPAATEQPVSVATEPALYVAPGVAAPASPIRVVLADDHALMRRGLRLLLDHDDGVEVIAEAEDLAAALRHVDGQAPNVLILDLGMPSGSSVETIGQLRERAPDTQIVVLTMQDNPVFAQRALAAGALGFVMKELADAELPRAIRAAASGEQYVSPRVEARLKALRHAIVEDKLTAREIEVLRLLALGHTSVEIARKLHLSPRTVETHRARIHRKLGLASRAELVRYALRCGLLNP